MTSTATTHHITIDGADLVTHVHGRPTADGDPALLLFGSPMDSSGFDSLIARLPGRTVITVDGRGTGASTDDDPTGAITPARHAADLAAVIEQVVIEGVGAGPVEMFGSSGGALVGLELVARRPELVSTLVAHEPPINAILPDAGAVEAECRRIVETYRTGGLGPAMARFLALISHTGPVPDDWPDRPTPDPATFGLPTTDDGSRTDAMVGRNLRGFDGWRPDVEALRSAPTRIVVAAGSASGGGIPDRASAVLADLLALEVTWFPSNHGGFLGGEFGQQGEPDAFAARLQEVLADA